MKGQGQEQGKHEQVADEKPQAAAALAAVWQLHKALGSGLLKEKQRDGAVRQQQHFGYTMAADPCKPTDVLEAVQAAVLHTPVARGGTTYE